MAVTTEAVVNVKALQKSLNQMTRDERIEIIRASGDPKVSVQVTVRDSDQPDAPPQPSPVAENILKERIKTFGFRTWSEGAPEGKAGADFAVRGEAKVKKLSARLEASGLPVTKYTLTSWTVKAVDLATGEEIYFNTTLPANVGSWNSEERGAEGDRREDCRRVLAGLLSAARERVEPEGRALRRWPARQDNRGGTRRRARRAATGDRLDGAAGGEAARLRRCQLAGTDAAGDLVSAAILRPLNAKLGQPCFALGAVAGDNVTVAFDNACAAAAVLSRLETNPPAGLYGAPPERQKSVIKDPGTLKKLTT